MYKSSKENKGNDFNKENTFDILWGEAN
jgi:hypothetical protein